MPVSKTLPRAFNDFVKFNGMDAKEHLIFNDEPSLTRQEFAEECDINTLMKKYEGHGQSINFLRNPVPEGGQYIDFTDLPQDLMGYMQFMADAERAFMTLPAIVRKEFDNNAIAFVDFASDPANIEQMREWELAPPAPAPKPPEPVVGAPAAAPPPAPAGAAEPPKSP